MTDIEITKLCAEAMGGKGIPSPDGLLRLVPQDASAYANIFSFPVYRPLHDDAQCFALVNKFQLELNPTFDLSKTIENLHPYNGWRVSQFNFGCIAETRNENLNRAICECVAKMQKGKE